MKRRFYVYAYFDDAGVPIYIGKGTGARMREHGRPGELKRCDSFFHRKLKKMKREGRKWSHRKLLTDLTEDESFMYERFFVAALGRRTNRTGPLCNSTDGGDRTNTGYRHSAESLKKIGDATRTRWKNPAMRARLGWPRGVSRTRTAEHTAATVAGQKRKRIEAARRGEGGCVHKRNGRAKWTAYFHKRYLGSFNTEEAAHAARRAAAIEWAASPRAHE